MYLVLAFSPCHGSVPYASSLWPSLRPELELGLWEEPLAGYQRTWVLAPTLVPLIT